MCVVNGAQRKMNILAVGQQVGERYMLSYLADAPAPSYCASRAGDPHIFVSFVLKFSLGHHELLNQDTRSAFGAAMNKKEQVLSRWSLYDAQGRARSQ